MERKGSPEFYKLLEEAAQLHERKSHDYANDDDPFGNYHFSGVLAMLFKDSPEDIGFVTRIGEKLFRLSVLQDKKPKNESVEDTERDLVVIMALWMASRTQRRNQRP